MGYADLQLQDDPLAAVGAHMADLNSFRQARIAQVTFPGVMALSMQYKPTAADAWPPEPKKTGLVTPALRRNPAPNVTDEGPTSTSPVPMFSMIASLQLALKIIVAVPAPPLEV